LKVTEQEQLMTSIDFDPVRSGDVIRSDLVNKLLAAVKSLDDRVSVLENEGVNPQAAVITHLLPPGDVVVGHELRIVGRRFAVPVGLNAVTVDGRDVAPILPGSNDTLLVVDIPDDFEHLPRDVTLTVSNGKATTSTTVRLTPPVQVPLGRLAVTDSTVSDIPIAVGGTYVFTYHLESRTNIAETYALAVVFANAAGVDEAVWRRGTSILGGEFVTLQPFKAIDIGVRVVIPAGATRVDLGLNVRSRSSSDPQLNPTSPLRAVVVGSTPETSDSRVEVVLGDLGPAASSKKFQDEHGVEGVQIPFSATGPVPITVTAKVSGRFRYEALVENGDPLWRVEPLALREADQNPGQPFDIEVDLTCRTPGPAPERRNLVVHATKVQPNGQGEFSGFTRFPIEGFRPQ
jgi:hypothetical protein